MQRTGFIGCLDGSHPGPDLLGQNLLRTCLSVSDYLPHALADISTDQTRDRFCGCCSGVSSGVVAYRLCGVVLVQSNVTATLSGFSLESEITANITQSKRSGLRGCLIASALTLYTQVASAT